MKDDLEFVEDDVFKEHKRLYSLNATTSPELDAKILKAASDALQGKQKSIASILTSASDVVRDTIYKIFEDSFDDYCLPAFGGSEDIRETQSFPAANKRYELSISPVTKKPNEILVMLTISPKYTNDYEDNYLEVISLYDNKVILSGEIQSGELFTVCDTKSVNLCSGYIVRPKKLF